MHGVADRRDSCVMSRLDSWTDPNSCQGHVSVKFRGDGGGVLDLRLGEKSRISGFFTLAIMVSLPLKDPAARDPIVSVAKRVANR